MCPDCGSENCTEMGSISCLHRQEYDDMPTYRRKANTIKLLVDDLTPEQIDVLHQVTVIFWNAKHDAEGRNV